MRIGKKIVALFMCLALFASLITIGVWAVTDTNFKVTGDINYSAPEKFSHEFVYYDETNNYYYLEMGTYGGNAVRWRYVSSDGETKFEPSSTNYPVTTTGSKGYFILETVTTSKQFHSSSTDYSISSLRTYLTGTSSGSFINDLGISTTNTIYKKITARAISELAVNGNYNSNNLSDSSYSSTSGSDKFWEPSVKELYTMVAGGAVSNSYINWTDDLKNNIKWDSFYWTRSFNRALASGIVSITTAVSVMATPVSQSLAVRPMFCLTF